nr:LysR family transcriptional regulator [Pseudomonas sp. BGr12]MDL2422158.1 LysR family transcriptional regulator [Pseudomonas sp. BGr12]
MPDIGQMNISTFDLNLLRVFDVLLREQNVSRAAERLALSQPTVSNALARLRELLDDPLLVRIGRRMQPTPKALALEGPIRAALLQIEQTLTAGDSFDPRHSRQTFRLAMTDFVEQWCMPALLRRLQDRAPNLRLDIVPLATSLPVDALDRGQLDLVVGRFNDIPARFVRHLWRSETLQIALRKDHPQVSGGLDLDTFLRLRHLWVYGGQTRGMVDQWLGEQGLVRQIVYTTPNYLQAAHLVAETDLCVVLPTQLARRFATLLPLQLFDLPFALEAFDTDVVYLAQRGQERALSWLVGEILQL